MNVWNGMQMLHKCKAVVFQHGFMFVVKNCLPEYDVCSTLRELSCKKGFIYVFIFINMYVLKIFYF